MKTCIHCGAQLHDSAAFCPVCTESQIEEKPAGEPRRWRKKAAVAAILLLVLAVGSIAAWRLSVRARTYDDGGAAVLEYRLNGMDYTLILTNANYPSASAAEPAPLMSNIIPPEVEYAFPSQLIIRRADTGEEAGELFFESVAECTAAAEALSGDAVTLEGPAPNRQVFKLAVMVADVLYTSECRSNEVTWHIRMKNGDILSLHQNVRVGLTPTTVYDYHDYDIDTAEKLQALLDQIAEEVGVDTLAKVILPCVEYEGTLSIRSRAIDLQGTPGSGGGNTTFRGCLFVDSDDPTMLTISGIDFVGDGEGVGLWANASCNLRSCSFTGYETGVLSTVNAWVFPMGCVFRDNGVGFLFDSVTCHWSGPEFWNNRFEGNGIGVQLVHLPADETLDLQGCVFHNNGVDIDNLCGQPLELTYATFD